MKNAKYNMKDKGASGEKYVFQLFVISHSAMANNAIKNIKTICDKYLSGRYELEIIDIYEKPSLAVKENIIIVPLLIKKFPLPEERLSGDLSDTEKVLNGFYFV